ncbi:MAG: alpha amylase catalytic subunit, partial [Promethearchaeota archaeon CR_4]
GVDGFRLDIINSIFEEVDVRKNKRLFHPYRYNLNHPDTLQFVKDLRKIMDEFSDPERFLVGEVVGVGSKPLIKNYYGEVVSPAKTNGLHLAFHPQTMRVGFSAKAYHRLFKQLEVDYTEPYIPTLLSTNHDTFRRISRLGNDVRKAKVSAVFQLTARGIPFVYYGEEIGMIQDSIPLKSAQDPMAQKFLWIPQWVMELTKKLVCETLNRDEVRTPMQWDASPNAGFSEEGVRTWLPVTKGYEKINVAHETSDQESLLICYKRLLRLRSEHPALNSGVFALLNVKNAPKSLLAYERGFNLREQSENMQCFLNFSKKSIQCQAPRALERVLFSTHQDTSPIQGTAINLAPFEAMILK